MKFKKSSSQENLTLTKQHYTLKEFLRHIDPSKKKLKKIEALFAGYFKSLQAGTGFDFNEIRDYKMGDDLRHISWKATAKTGELHTKEYFAEKEIRAYFLVDVSPSMFCGNKIDPFINLLAFLLNKSQYFCEKIGGVYFSDDIQYLFPVANVHSQSNIMFNTFFDFYNKLKDKIPLKPIKTDLSKGINFAKQFFQKKGIVFIISDFINLINWEKSLFNLSQKQNIYSFQIFDPVDFKLAKRGYMTLIDPETKEKFIVNTDSDFILKTYEAFTKEKQNKLNNFLNTVGIKHLIIEKGDFL